ncbi:MAG: ATP-binding protein [Victivallales bacterium]|jgi:predicted AAA+ superfamily ATPase|nr:ATP-binding protein [Victivallales bacterium]
MIIDRTALPEFLRIVESGKIAIVIGARQVGKTTLVSEALKERKTVILNFDIPFDVVRFKAASVLPPIDGMKSLDFPEVLVIDEAQRLPETAQIVKGWYDSKLPVKFVLLGSSSLNLLSQASESLTGRNRKIQLPPLTMSESLQAENWYRQEYTLSVIEEHFALQFRVFLLKSMVFGSYPEVVTSDDKIALLRELSGDYLWKDILQAGLVRTPDLLRRLLTLLAHQVGSEVSTNELSQQLGMSRVTIDRYLDLLEETFVIFRLPAYSTNPRKEIVKSKKIFFWDTGIRNALLNTFDLNENRPDIGSLFENYLISEIAKRNWLSLNPVELYFWRNKDRAEVDLVIKQGGSLQPYEIKWGKKRGSSTAFQNAYGISLKTITSTKPSDWAVI